MLLSVSVNLIILGWSYPVSQSSPVLLLSHLFSVSTERIGQPGLQEFRGGQGGVIREGCLEEAAGEGGKSSASFALEGGEMVVRVTQGCLAHVACPLIYGGHLSANLCPQVSSCQMSRRCQAIPKASDLPKARRSPAPAASRTMGTGLHSQSLRGPRPSYGKLQEPWEKPLEGRLRRALSLRQGREKARASDRGPEGLDSPSQEQWLGGLGDTEQLVRAQQEGSRRWLRQYQQVRRRWESFVAIFPSVTLSLPASPQSPLGTTS
ncbi:uncharacterized protein C11orf86 homolog isoform X2 [Pteropus medius]|uniref:uncharacterized protein C11orf86 homolog isoform X2 n=1 Tax=Pteropus vampyrus TaxID=132908 RepID=UPI00196B6E43|nr:uncharacterized protein C11orf86 homolog isoform X2 [Pteropus giganteus]